MIKTSKKIIPTIFKTKPFKKLLNCRPDFKVIPYDKKDKAKAKILTAIFKYMWGDKEEEKLRKLLFITWERDLSG